MAPDYNTIVSVVSLVFTVAGFVYVYFKAFADLDKKVALVDQKTQTIEKNYDLLLNKIDEIQKDISDLKDVVQTDISALKEDVTEIKVKNQVLWGAVEKSVFDFLHHPDHKERDLLLEKLKARTITLQEIDALQEMLESSIKRKDKESAGAMLQLAIIEGVRYDLLKLNKLKDCFNATQ